MKQKALTLSGDGLLKVLVTDVAVSEPFTGGQQKIEGKVYKGIWDTGASSSTVNKKIIKELVLKPIARTDVHTANGTKSSPVFLVNFLLPSNVLIGGVRVTEAEINGADILIGMDVITLGDFSITNHKQKTKMSFRVPSCHSIDYVKIANEFDRKEQLAKYLPKSKKKVRKKRK